MHKVKHKRSLLGISFGRPALRKVHDTGAVQYSALYDMRFRYSHKINLIAVYRTENSFRAWQETIGWNQPKS